MKLCLSLIFLFISISAFGNIKAEVHIVDRDNNPVAGATVSVVGKNDSTLVDAAISDGKGIALLNFDAAMPAVILVNCLGFEPAQTDYSNALTKIVLHEAANQLNEVVVTSRPRTLKRQAGKFVYDPAELKKEVPDLYGLLRLTPLLHVDGSAFSILGKGQSKVFINGRDPQMDDQALVEMLRAMPATQIKSVEIITEPGSTYSASMSGGIVNLILDKPNEGFIGSITAETTYHTNRLSPTLSFWGGYSKGKLNLGTSLLYYGANNLDAVTSKYYYGDTDRYITNRTRNSSWMNQAYGRINASYDLTDKSTVGVAFNIGESKMRTTSKIFSSEQIGNNAETFSDSRIETVQPWERPNYGFQAYYTLKTDNKGSNLDITGDYASNISTTNTEYIFTKAPEQQYTRVISSGWHIKPRYHFVFNGKHTLDAGAEFFHYKIDNDYKFRADDNHFIYKETVSSAYAQWNARWSELFSSNIGLRMENSDINGEQEVASESFHHNYTDLFPSLSINFNLPGKGNQSISLSATRFISRPFYSKLNPFVYWTSETTCRKGNPDLMPSYTWMYNLYYSFLNDWVWGAFYRSSPNAKLDYTFREGDITVSSTGAFASFTTYSTYFSYNHVFGGFWRLKGGANFYYNVFNGQLDGIDLSRKGVEYSLEIFNSIVLSKKAKIRLQIFYRLASPYKLFGRTGRYDNDISAHLIKWFGNSASISLDAYNLLNSRNDSHYSTPEYSYSNHSEMYRARFDLKFTYIFGKRKVSGADDRYSTPLDSRLENSN